MRIFIGSRAQYEEVNPHPNANDCFIQRRCQFGNSIRDELSDCVQNDLEYEIIILNNVTRIGNEAFKVTNQNAVCNRLCSVTILGNLVSIGREAFKGCSHLQTINGVGIETANEIGDSAFEGCLNLTNYPEYLPNLESVGADVFRECSIPHNIIGRIDTHSILLYHYNDNQTNIILPEVNEIGNGVFKGHTELQAIQIPDSVTRIGENAFKGCSGLSRLGSDISAIPKGRFILPTNITTIEDGTFEGCTQLQSIQIPDSVTRIGWFAFAGCTCLESILLNAVTEIGGGAFYNCTNLQSATIPNVERIGWYAFAACPRLSGVDISVSATQDGGFIRSGAFCRDNLLPNSSSIFAEGDPRVDRWTAPLDNNIIEDDILNRMVNGIIEHYNDDGWLNQFYRWELDEYNNNEVNTTITFNRFSNGDQENRIVGLIDAVCDVFANEERTLDLLKRDVKNPRIGDVGTLKKRVQDIFDWGNGRNSMNEINDFTVALINIRNEQYYDTNFTFENRDYINYMVEKGKNINTYRIAFWSKVLAAYKPGACFIYDSRVAIALSYISLYLNLPVIWSIPDPRESLINKKAFERFSLSEAGGWSAVKANRALYGIPQGGYDIPRCYCLYLDLLERLANRMIQQHFDSFRVPEGFNQHNPPSGNEIREQYINIFTGTREEKEKKAIMAHLEKMLFMMKEDILDRFRD